MVYSSYAFMEHLFLKAQIRKNIKGFTLLEVLIVIAIIGILVSIGLASYSSAQQKSRDARRKGDLKAMQNAWEQYYADSTNASYPSSCGTIDATYLPQGLPTDPKTGSVYTVATCSTSAYCFCATVESAAAANSDGSCNYQSATKTSYCVSNLQ